MGYSKEDIETALEKWNAAVRKLPKPESHGLLQRQDGFRFRCLKLTDGQTGKERLYWELMTSNWNETGIIWPESMWTA